MDLPGEVSIHRVVVKRLFKRYSSLQVSMEMRGVAEDLGEYMLFGPLDLKGTSVHNDRGCALNRRSCYPSM